MSESKFDPEWLEELLETLMRRLLEDVCARFPEATSAEQDAILRREWPAFYELEWKKIAEDIVERIDTRVAAEDGLLKFFDPVSGERGYVPSE